MEVDTTLDEETRYVVLILIVMEDTHGVLPRSQ